MIPSLSIGSRTLLNDCNHSAAAIFWRSAITRVMLTVTAPSPVSSIHMSKINK